MPPPAKTEPPSAAAAAKAEKGAAPAPAEAAPSAPEPAAAGGFKAWLPAILAILVAPALTWAVAQYVVVPRLQKKLALPSAKVAAAALATTAPANDGRPKEPPSYEFANVVVNLAGTMGTRYLKTTLDIIGSPTAKTNIKQIFEENRPMLYDRTISVLSSLTLADLEEPGAKNVIREKLVNAYNQALNRQVVDQVYFGDFVVQ